MENVLYYKIQDQGNIQIIFKNVPLGVGYLFVFKRMWST